MIKSVVRLVWREIESVEAKQTLLASASLHDEQTWYIPGMRLGQCRWITRLLNGKPSWPVGPLQILKTIDRNSRGTSGELKQSGLLLRIPGAHDLPEILDDVVLLLEATVVRVLLPVFHIDIRNTSNQQLQLTLIEHVDQISWDQLIETRHESIELLLDALLDLPFRDQPIDND